MKLHYLLILFCLSVVIGQSYAAVRQYNAKLENVKWQVSRHTQLSCHLTHEIPRYGDAVFSSEAAKKPLLYFELDMLRLPESYGMASVMSVAPKWRPGVPNKMIADMALLKQFNGELPNQAAWTMLSELENGMQPTIYYADWNSPFDKVAVSLNSINFHKAYEEFLLCRDALLPFSFDDIKYTVLTYKMNTTKLTKVSQKRLNMIGEYLKADPQLELGLVNAYTDSHGGRSHNKKLSKQRAEVVKTFFTENGVAPERIQTTGFGEKRHIASNSNVLDRARNRRVVIQLSKM